MNMKDMLVESVLSKSLQESLRFYMYEDEKPKEEPKIEEEVIEPPEEITLEKLKAITDDSGAINMVFPENFTSEFEGRTEFPESYFTLSSKERLLLLFAENFRRQFKEKYLKRRPLILAAFNECNVQKFVSTTIKPTAFVMFPNLIDSWENCANFVADYVTFEPLEKPTSIPTRLLSPETVLSRRKGNSFEMATLLCSVLVGFGFPALVVSGYATREVTLNNQQRVDCPYKMEDKNKEEEIDEPSPKYKLKEPPFLKSKFLLSVESRQQELENEKLMKLEQERLEQIAEMEKLPPDEFAGYRRHAWIVMIKYAPWCYKPDFKKPNEEEDDEDEDYQPTAFFIEPSTGFRHEVSDPCYLGIESVWNHQNYYVNRQYPDVSIADMKWDLGDTENWEHLLLGEPFELRKPVELEEGQEPPTEDDILATEKHLDMPFSWVDTLHINSIDYEERYPNGEKKEYYKYAIYEKFAPYKNTNGLMKRLTLFETLDYENATFIYEWYENRDDLLDTITTDVKDSRVEKQYSRGRSDSLKTHIHYSEGNREVILKFYSQNRFDCLKELIFDAAFVEENYQNRRDLLYYRKFVIKPKDPNSVLQRGISGIIEKFQRNKNKSAYSDIAIRNFKRNENKIFLQFHYGDDCITATTREFKKPNKSEMGEETTFNPDDVTGYISNPWEKQMSGLDLYYLLQDQIKDEEKCLDDFHARYAEIEEMLELLNQEMKNPVLKFSIFDPLRNDAARKLRLQRFEQMKNREDMAKKQQADFLAPYLVQLEDRRPDQEQIEEVIVECLKTFKGNYDQMIKELQRRYDEAGSELNSMKRFLHRYLDQFTEADYEKFIKEGENIESYRKILQQRIAHVKEECNRKYENLKESIKSDPRLKARQPTLKFQEEDIEISETEN